jgi:hypothetical protein
VPLPNHTSYPAEAARTGIVLCPMALTIQR